ncbi:MAG: tripartite tricarboxylate transporter substrate binding protein [Peptococcaceae bacterium]|nr:tripartite tricarboxylate transporter substrate binding protein [Peptococcaceae bacterium]
MKKMHKWMAVSLAIILVIATLAGCSSGGDKSNSLTRDNSTAIKLTRANGETYPNRQIELIIPLAAGGGTDVFCRQIANALYKIIGQPVVVNNMEGSSGMKGIGAALQAKPDGYTLIAFNPPSQPLAQMLLNPGFDMRNLTPINYYAYDAVCMLARTDLPYNTFPEVLEAYKSGKLTTIGATGVGSLDEIGARLLKKDAGLNYQKTVTYNGSGELVSALLRGEVPIGFAPTGSSLTQIKDKELKAIMVLTNKRFPALPDVPAYGQDYKGVNIDAVVQQNRIIAGPPGLPDDIRDYLDKAIQQALKDKDLIAWAEKNNLPILGKGSQDAKAVLNDAFKIPELIPLDQLKQK